MFYLSCHKRGNNILLRYINNNKEIRTKLKYKPSLYIKTVNTVKNTVKSISKYTSLHGDKLKRIQFDTIKDANKAIFEAKDTGIDYYGNRNFNLTFLHEQFKNNEYNPKLIRTFIIDIECPSDKGFPDPMLAEWQVDCLTIYDNITDCYYLFSLYDFDKNSDLLSKYNIQNIKHVKFKNETQLLKGLLGFWQSNFPVNVSGWNSSGFDFPYLFNRLTRLGLDPKKLSPWNVCEIKTKINTFNKEYQQVYILGVNDLDYINLYKKNRFKPRESYKLGFIGGVEQVSEKVDYSSVASNLKTLNKKDPNLYQIYNIIDVYIVKGLDDKLGFFDVTFSLGYLAGINFSEVSSPVGLWENIIYKNTIDDNIITPPKKDQQQQSFAGGFVLDPKIGKHKWLMSSDLNSLYPHLIMQYNISPEKITTLKLDINIDKMIANEDISIPNNLCVTPNGCTFKTDSQGLLPRLMEKLYNERKKIKKEMLTHHQKAISIKDNIITSKSQKEYDHEMQQYRIKDGNQLCRKLALNSAYGALANVHFSLFDIRLAESITTSGQLSIKWINNKLNTYFNELLCTDNVRYIYATDTDSTMFSMERFVELNCKNMETMEIVEYLDRWCKSKLEPLFDKWYQELANYTKAFQQKMVMAREMIASDVFFVAKKRYAANVLDMEGVRYTIKEPYLKIMGLDLVKSSTPEVCRNAMTETVKIILTKNELELQNYIKDFHKEYNTFSVHQIAAPKGVNKLEESYCRPDGSFRHDVTVPFNSRAAINYNNELKKLSLTDYEVINNGDKMRYIYLEEPNRLNQNVIGFVDVFPKEFKLDNKVDYDTMYYKTFIKPITGITDVIGWDIEPKPTLDPLFI